MAWIKNIFGVVTAATGIDNDTEATTNIDNVKVYGGCTWSIDTKSDFKKQMIIMLHLMVKLHLNSTLVLIQSNYVILS